MKIVYKNNTSIIKIIITSFLGHTGQFPPKFYFREVEVDLTAKQNHQIYQL
jgi:hypothetical protein